MTALAVVLVPSAAEAAKKSVFAGPPRAIDSMPENVNPARFFPKRIKVAQGRSVDFHFRGFHTVTFLGGSARPGFFTTDGQKVSGFDDAAGNPFWFNGQDRRLVNPAVALPAGDAKVDNAAVENSGLPQGEDQPPPYTLEFPRKGTYKYLCLIHPKMKGRVTVLRNERNVPSAKRDEVRVSREVARVVKAAKRKAAYPGPGGPNVRAGNDNKDLEVIGYFPKDLTVKAGTTVRWFQNHIHEFHTITFGPQEYLEPLGESFVTPDASAPQGGPPTLVVHPQVLFRSDAPGTTPSYDGANHGNGFLNSGLLSTDPLAGLAREFKATFPKPGVYPYLCLVHGPDMSGKVTVTS